MGLRFARFAPRGSKYKNRRTQVDGIVFASAKEARRYQELRLLERAGEVSHLVLQPRYGLYVKPFLHHEVALSAHGELLHCGDWIGDFQYYRRDGELIVEDVKGVKTAVYRLKKRLIEALYGFQITEV